MKRAIRDALAQIGNHWRNGEFFEGSIGSKTSKGPPRCTVFLDARTSSRRRLQYQEGEKLRKCWNEANLCFSTAMLFKLQDWYSIDHGFHTPLRRAEDGSGEQLQPNVHRLRHVCRESRHAHRDPMQNQKQNPAVVSTDREHRDGCTN